jgi:SnoaL-like domain
MRVVHDFKNGVGLLRLMAFGPISLLCSGPIEKGFAAEPEMSAVDKLVAIEDIHQLNARYFRCVNQKDWDCWRALFTPDSTLQGKKVGPQGMIEHVRANGLYDRVRTTFNGHMTEIEILSPTVARGIFAADWIEFYPLGQSFQTTGKEVVAPGKTSHTYVYYYDTYVKLNNKWQFQNIEVKTLLRIDNNGDITVKTEETGR